MKKQLTVLICVFFITSCSLIHFLSVKGQKAENRVAYQKYLLKNKYDTSLSFQLLKPFYDSISILPYTINTYKLKYKTKASPVQIRVYKSDGTFINGYEQCFGDINRIGLLDSFPLKKINHLPINYNLRLESDIRLFSSNKDEQDKLLSICKSKKYVFILFYAEWTGYYSNITLKKLKTHLLNHETELILLKVNTSP